MSLVTQQVLAHGELPAGDLNAAQLRVNAVKMQILEPAQIFGMEIDSTPETAETDQEKQ